MKTLVAINLAMRGIYYVLAYTMHNYEFMTQLSENSGLSSEFRCAPFTPALSVSGEGKIRGKGCPITCQAGIQGRERFNFIDTRSWSWKGGWSGSGPSRFILWRNTSYRLYRRLGGPQGSSVWVQKKLVTQRFEPRTVQPAEGRYTHYTMPAAFCLWWITN